MATSISKNTSSSHSNAPAGGGSKSSSPAPKAQSSSPAPKTQSSSPAPKTQSSSPAAQRPSETAQTRNKDTFTPATNTAKSTAKPTSFSQFMGGAQQPAGANPAAGSNVTTVRAQTLQQGQPRTTEQALQEARDFLVGSAGNADQGNGRQLVTNPGNSNDPADVDPNSDRYKAAQAQVQANRALETEKLAQLSPEDRAKYQNVQTHLANDPVAQLGMQVMLLEGRLPGAKSGGGDHGTTLDQLDKMTTQKMAQGLEGQRDTLLAQVVKEVAIPESINQGGKGTCGATAATTAIARLDPAEYVRIVGGLASPEGTVTLADGKTQIGVENGTLADDGSGRSLSQRLIEPALMELGNDWRDYDNGTDQSSGGLLPPNGGLSVGGVEHILEAALNKPFDSYASITTWFGLGYSNANNAINAVNSGKAPVIAMVEFPGGLHFVTVDRVAQENGTQYVYFTNPWGQTERMSYEDFSKMARGVVQPS